MEKNTCIIFSMFFKTLFFICCTKSAKVSKLGVLDTADEVVYHIDYYVQPNQLGSQWPLGIVPYYLSLNDYDQLVHRRMRKAMNNLEDSSCIKFKALSEPSHFAPWIHISNPEKIRECVHLGENNTYLEIPLVLGYDCLNHREILHSLMHAIGFKDEVMHPQRDQYIRIQWENINPKYHPLFRVQYQDFAPIRIEYDPSSIMHFHDRAFSKNGQATIAPLLPGLQIGSTGELSSLDKMKLRLIFGHECNKRKVGDLLDSCKSVMISSSVNKTEDGITNLKGPDDQNIDKNNNEKTEVNENNGDNDNTQDSGNTGANSKTVSDGKDPEVNDKTRNNNDDESDKSDGNQSSENNYNIDDSENVKNTGVGNSLKSDELNGNKINNDKTKIKSQFDKETRRKENIGKNGRFNRIQY